MSIKSSRVSTTCSRRARNLDAKWGPLVACCLGTFLVLLYTSIVTVSLPDITAQLGATHGQGQWVIDAYTVALAGLLLGAGAVGDAFGTRRVFLVGTVGFGLATLSAAAAPTADWLIASRAIQGVAAAGMFATIPALLAEAYRSPQQRSAAFAAWGTVAGWASAVGTVAGGLVAPWLGWRALFLVGVPLCTGLLALVITTPSERIARPPARGRVDWAGTGAITVAVGALAYTAISAGDAGWTAPSTVSAAGIAAMAGLCLMVAERRVASPILPLGLVTSRRFVAVLATAFAYYFATFGPLPSAAAWLRAEGVSGAAVSGILVSQLVVFMAASAAIGPRLHRLAPGKQLRLPLLLIAVGAASGTLVLIWPAWPTLVPFLALSGFGAGVISPALPALTIACSPQRWAATASSATNAARQLGLAMGVAVCGALTRGADAASVAGALGLSGLVALGAAVLVAGLLPASRP